MLPYITIFFSSFVIALSGALMPGPLLTATISESSRRGAHAGPLLIVGHGILELALVIALMLGLAPFLRQEEVFIVTAFAGALILFWMGANMLRSLPDLTLSWDAGTEKHSHLVMTGILMSIANPYWIIWWVTIGLGYIVYSIEYGIWGVLFFFSGHILADLAWYAFISAAVCKGRHFISNRVYRVVIGACALFLIFFGGYFAYAGFQKIVVYV